MEPTPALTKEQASAIASALVLSKISPPAQRPRIGWFSYLSLFVLLIVSALIVYYAGLGETVALVVYVAVIVAFVSLKFWAARS
jgi:hypothetical protein